MNGSIIIAARPVLFLIMVGMAGDARPQEHPFLSEYELHELPGGIRIDWTIEGGSTCNGQEVERSPDGVTFSPVHRIEGICGDPSVPVSYGWYDDAPPEFSLVHYRIKLGFDGYSSVKSVRFDQLTTSEQRFFPSPMTGEATLVLRVPPSALVELRIWDEAGRLVLERSNIAGPVITIRLWDARPGVYTYIATGDRRTFTGRFVKE